MLIARVVAVGFLSLLALTPAPATATGPAATQHGATKLVIRRIEPTPPVVPAVQDASAAIPVAGSADASLESRLDQQARELANLLAQVAALHRALNVLLVSIENALQRPEPTSADIAAPTAARSRCGMSPRTNGSPVTPCSSPARPLNPQEASRAPSR